VARTVPARTAMPDRRALRQIGNTRRSPSPGRPWAYPAAGRGYAVLDGVSDRTGALDDGMLAGRVLSDDRTLLVAAFD